MKKFLFVLLAALTTVLILAFSVSAACTHENKENASVSYQDYTSNGELIFTCPDCTTTAIKLDPLVSFSGYSTSESGNGICAGYTVNVEALSEIKRLNGDFELGMVAASKALLGQRLPLDSKTADPIDLSEFNADVLKVDISEYEAPNVDLVISGFGFEEYLEPIYLSAYAYDGNEVVYLQNSQSNSDLAPIIFVEANKTASVTIDGMEYSVLKETEQAYDRLRQMEYSKSTYKTGSSMSGIKLGTVQLEAYAIVVGGSALGYSNAASFLNHFLSNKGTQYNLDLSNFLKDSTALSNRNAHINTILRAGEALAIENISVTVNQTSERINNNLGGDWHYSLGSYFDDVDLINLKVNEVDGEKVYSATVKYYVIDFYNWNEGSTNGFLNGMGPSQYQLYQLHRAGKACEFLTYGEISYDITWTQGQTVDQIAAFN